MEATVLACDRTLKIPPWTLLREPLLWAAATAFVGAAVGLIGTFAEAHAIVSMNPSLRTILFAEVTRSSGEMFATLSLLGVTSVLGGQSKAAVLRSSVIGGALLVLFLAASATAVFLLWYVNMGDKRGSSELLSLRMDTLLTLSFFASLFLSPAVALPFAIASFVSRKTRLGAVLSGLCVLSVPFGLLGELLFPPGPDAYVVPSAAPVLFGWIGGVSLLSAPLWVLLGVMFFRETRDRVFDKAWRVESEENRKKARRLYKEGLARGDLSVVDELVSEDFRDFRHGARGKLGMERALQSLWRSFPDLSVRIEEQETEGDLVKTNLVLSGTDRGGVLWYPATNRRATFSAEFVDRFRDGRLVEHGGETGTEGLLQQLGLSRAGDRDA